MEEMILIPKSQYLKMLESYDQVIKELEEKNKLLEAKEPIEPVDPPTPPKNFWAKIFKK